MSPGNASNGIERAPNIEAILNWCKECRPDILGEIQSIISHPHEHQQGFLFLLTIGFAAGRKYQSEHSELSPDIYHRLP